MEDKENKPWTSDEKVTALSILVLPIYALVAFEGCGELYKFLNKPMSEASFILIYGTIATLTAAAIRIFIKSKVG